MDIFYFLVTSLDAYKDQYGFHSAYFVEGPGFITGFILAIVIGAVTSLVFYFGFCNGKSVKQATRINWVIMLLVAAVFTYFVSDILVIGSEGQPGTGFYAFCETFCNNYTGEHYGNEQAVNACVLEYKTIIENLKQGKDVAFMFNISNVIYSVLVFFLTSLGVKNLTKHGSQIPF